MPTRSPSRYYGGTSHAMDDFFNQQLERFFGMNPYGGSLRASQNQSSPNSSLPAVNVRENDGDFEIQVAAPGMQRDAFRVDVEDDVLTISAETKSESQSGDDQSGFHRREFSYSSFERRFQLPTNVKDDQISATYEDGILKLRLPKMSEEESGPKRRTIEIGSSAPSNSDGANANSNSGTNASSGAQSNEPELATADQASNGTQSGSTNQQ